MHQTHETGSGYAGPFRRSGCITARPSVMQMARNFGQHGSFKEDRKQPLSARNRGLSLRSDNVHTEKLSFQKRNLNLAKKASNIAISAAGTLRLRERNGHPLSDRVQPKSLFATAPMLPVETVAEQLCNLPEKLSSPRILEFGTSASKWTEPNNSHLAGPYTNLIKQVGAIRISDDPISARRQRNEPYERRGAFIPRVKPELNTEVDYSMLDAEHSEMEEPQTLHPMDNFSPERKGIYQRVMDSFIHPGPFGLVADDFESNIMAISKQKEESSLPSLRRYMLHMANITLRQRELLVGWVVETHARYKLEQETLFLTISLVDRFMAMKHQVLTTSYLQLLGAICLNICSKYEDIVPFCLKDVGQLRTAWKKADLELFETALITDLRFHIGVPTSLFFLKYYFRVVMQFESIFDDKLALLAEYLISLALHCPDIITDFKPSIVAAAALFLARRRLGKNPVWPPEIESASSFDPHTTGATLVGMLLEFWRLSSEDLESQQFARVTFNKFSSKKYLRVALLKCNDSPDSKTSKQRKRATTLV